MLNEVSSYCVKDIEIGMKAEFDIEISKKMVDSFINLSGDVSPLHLDMMFAKKNAFDGEVVHGLLTSSFFSTLIGVYLPGKFGLLHSINISYLKPVYIGDKLNISGEVIYKNKSLKAIDLKSAIMNSSGLVVSKASIRVLMLA